MIGLEKFSELASLGHRIEVRDNSDGVPTLQVAQEGFKGKMLAALSHVPFLKDIHAVAEYRQQLKIDNAQALGVFLYALSQKFGDKVAVSSIIKNEIDLSGDTPLEGRIVTQLIKDAKGMADRAQRTNGAETQEICGFRNLGNTCYANSTLKFLIHSLGDDRLVNHLESFKNTTTDPIKRDSADKLIAVVKASYAKDEPLEKELRELFFSLQKLDTFSQKDGNGELLFKIVGVQNDAQEFLVKLSDTFNFSEIEGCAMSLKESLVKGTEHRPPKSTLAYSHDTTVTDPKVTLQDIIDNTHKAETVEVKWGDGDSENTQVSKVKQWSVPDLSTFHRFNLHINSLNYDVESGELRRAILEKANFTDDVTLFVLDEKTNKTWTVTLEPREVVIQQGSATSGHYYIYAKQGENSWARHDDSTVHACSDIGPKDQAKLISFSIKQKFLSPAENSYLGAPGIGA